MTTATKSIKKHVWDWLDLEAAIKADVSPIPSAKISEEGKSNAIYVEEYSHSSERYIQLCDRVFAKCTGRNIALFYLHRVPGSSSRHKMHQVNAYPAAQGRTMYEVIGQQMHWFAERYLPEMECFKSHNGCRTKIYGQKGVYQRGDGPVYEYTGMSPDKPLLRNALEQLRSHGASDEMMQAASLLGGQLEDKVAPYKDCLLRYAVEKRVDDMVFAAKFDIDEEHRRYNGRNRDTTQLPANMVFDCLLYHPMRVLDSGRYGRSWVEPPVMRVGVCLLDRLTDAEARPMFHVCSVNAGYISNYSDDSGVPLLDVMLTQHIHKLWTPVTEWLAQNVYVPGV